MGTPAAEGGRRTTPGAGGRGGGEGPPWGQGVRGKGHGGEGPWGGRTMGGEGPWGQEGTVPTPFPPSSPGNSIPKTCLCYRWVLRCPRRLGGVLWEAGGCRGVRPPSASRLPKGENLVLRMTPSFCPTMCRWLPLVLCSHCWPLAMPSSSQSSWGLWDRLIIWVTGSGEGGTWLGPSLAQEAGRRLGTYPGGRVTDPFIAVQPWDKQLHICASVCRSVKWRVFPTLHPI